MTRRGRVIVFGWFAMLFAMLAAWPACSPAETDNPDVTFAKAAFFSMVNGSSDAEAMIDWENFRALGDDVGKGYRKLPNEAEKAKARKEFIAGFALSTPNMKANPDGITNWRVYTETPSETIISAKMKAGPVLYLTVSKRGGSQKLSALRIE